MKLFLVIAISTVVLGQIFARPSNVEVEKHHVVEISRNFNITAMNSTAKIDETRRILKEIDRINQSLGYTKKNLARTDSVSDSLRLSDALFFPKTPFHPPGLGKSSDRESEVLPSQRVKYKKEVRQGKTEGRKFLIIPLDPSFVAILPHFSPRTARLSKKWNKKPLKSQKKEYEKTEPPPLLKQNSLFNVLIDEMVDDDEDDQEDSSSLPDNDAYLNDLYKDILVGQRKRDLPKEETVNKEAKFPLITTKKPKTTTRKPPKPSNKPKPTTKKPPTKKPAEVPNPDDLKSPFSSLFRPASEQLKDSGGGIIIQRLKVRKGGIAIAGPGGVATAGSGGTAIVGPGGIAFTHPRGLTIAGPGAKVFSVPENVDLESMALNSTSRDFSFPSLVATGPIVYYNPGKYKVEHRSADEEVVTTLPYYGGAKGSVLKIEKKPDGSLVAETVPDQPRSDDNPSADFSSHLSTIQQAAAILVALQDRVRMSGKLSGADKRIYADHLEMLGISAQKLAQLQNEAADNDLNLLFQGIGQDREETRDSPANEGDFDHVGEEEPEKNPEATEEPPQQVDQAEEGIAVNAPSKDAPVAEAKPIGLAVAGPGGLAASRPVATAIVSKDGLAVARPVATAISGITPEQFSMLSLPNPQKINFGGFPSRPRQSGVDVHSLATKYGLLSLDNGVSVLVGPGYQTESRFSDKGIDAEDDKKAVVIDLESDNNAKTVAMEKFNKLAEAPKELIPNQYPLIPPRIVPLSFRLDGPGYPEHQFENFPPQYLPPSEHSSLPYPFLPVYPFHHDY